MQKKLIALAVAGLVAAPAFAQSNVTIGGYLSLSYKNYKMGDINRAAAGLGGRGAAAVGFNAENRLDDDWNSRFWLTGSEDIGGGNKAVFRIEQRLNLDMGANGTGNGFAAGESYLGLQTKDFGLFTFGRRHVYFTEGIMWDAVWAQSTSNFTGYGPLTQFVNGAQQNLLTRTNNLITWQSPVWNGFKARLDYSFAPLGNEGAYNPANSKYNEGSLWGTTLNYDNGPLSVFFSYFDSKVEGRTPFFAALSPIGAGAASSYGQAAVNDTHGYKVGAKYMLPLGSGKLQLAGIIDRSTMENVGATAATAVDWKRTSWSLPIKYLVGPHTISFTWTQAGKTSNVADSKAKMFNLGYQYALSKRTYVGANWAQVKNDDGAAYQVPLAFNTQTLSGAALTYGEKARVLSVTLAHMF